MQLARDHASESIMVHEATNKETAKVNGTLPSAGICRCVENSFFKREQPLEFPGPNKNCTKQTTAVNLIGSLVLSLPPHTLTL